MWDRENQPREMPSGPPGVIETIGVAFTRLVARPWIVLGPVLLDLWMWLGLKITAGPLVLKISEEVRPLETIGGPVADFLERQVEYNLSELLSMNLFMVRMPTFIPLIASEDTTFDSLWRPELVDVSWWLLTALVPVLLITGFVIGAAFLLLLGDIARDLKPRFEVRQLAMTTYRLIYWAVAGLSLLVLLTWPLLVTQGVLVYAGYGINGILLFLMSFPVGIGFILFYFSVYAIVLDGVTATQAFRSSYRVVRANGWESLAFIVSYMITTGGFPFFWRLLIDEAPGTLIAVIGNAFVSTGMIAAGMIYYQDRAEVVRQGEQLVQAG